MDLVRKILLDLEEKDHSGWVELKYDNYDKQVVSYHVKILNQAGLIEAKYFATTYDGYEMWIAKDLTWEGQEFLDAARNDTVWNNVKKKVAEQGGNIPFDVLKEMLKQTLRMYMMGQ